MSPSEYEFTRNYSKIYASLLFCEEELNNWYNLVKENNNERISLIHNNLELNHYIRGEDKDYLISWDKAKIDSPVFEFYRLYRNQLQKHSLSQACKTCHQCPGQFCYESPCWFANLLCRVFV